MKLAGGAFEQGSRKILPCATQGRHKKLSIRTKAVERDIAPGKSKPPIARRPHFNNLLVVLLRSRRAPKHKRFTVRAVGGEMDHATRVVKRVQGSSSSRVEHIQPGVIAERPFGWLFFVACLPKHECFSVRAELD